MDNQKQILAFLTMKRYSSPFNEKDLIDAIEFGKTLCMEGVKELMVGMVVNGTMQTVLLEEKLKELK